MDVGTAVSISAIKNRSWPDGNKSSYDVSRPFMMTTESSTLY